MDILIEKSLCIGRIMDIANARKQLAEKVDKPIEMTGAYLELEMAFMNILEAEAAFLLRLSQGGENGC